MNVYLIVNPNFFYIQSARAGELDSETRLASISIYI